MSSRLHWVVSIVTLFLLVSLIFYTVFRPAPRIAYVDSAKLINGYQGMIDARKIYQNKASGWQANVDTLTKEVERRLIKYEKESPTMSKKERDLSRELIRAKEQQLREYGQATNAQAQQEDAKMTSDIIAQINLFIGKYGKNQNYTIIFGAANGNVVFAQDVIDLTDEVLLGLNSEYKGQ